MAGSDVRRTETGGVSSTGLSRRRFVRYAAMFAVGGRALLRSGDARAAADAARAAAGSWPAMEYTQLGRTGFRASRLVMGCGASLMFRSRDSLLDAAFDAGINVYDVGYRGYYRDAEENLAPFLAKVRDRVFLISKARVDLEVEDDAVVSSDQARQAARSWSERLDASLKELKTERVDAYYLMASNNPSLIASAEVYEAFRRAKEAGKVKHLGVSTHRNAEKVLGSAVATGWYDLAMVAVTPAGWYDWESKAVLAGSPPLASLRPVLDRAREAGVGLVGMKAARALSGLPVLGWWSKPDTFDAHYGEGLRTAKLSPFQRSYAYVLAHGLDVVNADMSSLAHLQENVVAATTAQKYFA